MHFRFINQLKITALTIMIVVVYLDFSFGGRGELDQSTTIIFHTEELWIKVFVLHTHAEISLLY